MRKENLYHQLWGNLEIDIAKIKRELDWQPRTSVDVCIEKTVQAFIDSNG